MDTTQNAEEIALDKEEAELRQAAVERDPVRPEDAKIHDDAHPEPNAGTGDDKAKSGKRGQQTGAAKAPAATGAEQPGSKATDATAKKPDADPKATQEPNKDPNATADKSKQQTPFQRERERLNKQWETVNAENERIRKERATLEQERQQFEQQRKSAATTTKKPADHVSSAEWDAIAKDFEAEGKTGLAEKAKQRAAEARKVEEADKAAPAKTEKFSPEEIATMQTEWNGHLERLGKENPDLTKADTPLRTRVAQLLKAAPVLSMRGDGIILAVEHAKLAEKASQVDGLNARIAELEAENKRLSELTSLPSGGAAPAQTAKKFEDMTPDEQEAELRRRAQAADRG